MISTGVIRPFSCAVCALKALQNSMMLTPCWPSAGPTGGAGFACPPGICSLMTVRIFFAMFRVRAARLQSGTRSTSIQLLHLVESELELHLRARPLGGRGARLPDPVDLALPQRHGLRAGADEAGHAGRVLDHRPRVVVQVHVHEHVAGEDALLRLHLLPVLRLDHLLGRDDDAAEAGPLPHRLDAVLEVGLDLVHLAGIGVDDVPAEQAYGSWLRGVRRDRTLSIAYFRSTFETTFFQISSFR